MVESETTLVEDGTLLEGGDDVGTILWREEGALERDDSLNFTPQVDIYNCL